MPNRAEGRVVSKARIIAQSRISVDRPKEGLGNDRQESETMEMISERWPDAEIVATVREVDKSTSARTERPDLAKIVRMVEAGEADYLCNWHPDRLFRDVAEAEEFVRLAQRRATLALDVQHRTLVNLIFTSAPHVNSGMKVGSSSILPRTANST